MKVVVVGMGAIGKGRTKVLTELGEEVIPVDPLYYEMSYKEALTFNPDWIFVCTPHDTSIDYVRFGLEDGCNVLVEKPYLGDLKPTNVGLNYRFYKGVRQLLDDMGNELFGQLISVNMILALGDAPGSEETWRLNPIRAGRGAMLDPGIHLIDLAMLMTDGNLSIIDSKSVKNFWRTGIEEETHLIAWDYRFINNVDKQDRNTIYNIQASVCRWRNNFRIEVNGTDGYGVVEGRGRNYGNQTYRRGKRWGWQSGKSQKNSEELVVDYDGGDSFLEETKAVLYGCNGIQPATHEDNKRCLEFINSL